MKFLLIVLLCSFSSFAQESEIQKLQNRVQELEEISAEQSEISKRQLKDQYYDQNSRGYIEIKIGRSVLSPKDVEDENNDMFNDLDDANWESFDYANIIDFEIGKSILAENGIKHEIGIGYQHLRSKELEADYTPSGGGGRARVIEKISAHTIFGRYALLMKPQSVSNLMLGPGFTLGYSPVSEISIQVEQGNEGEQVIGESDSYLIEVFGKMKYEFSRYFSFVLTTGYRMQEAENLRLNAADVATVKTSIDLDMSGFFGTVGMATAF